MDEYEAKEKLRELFEAAVDNDYSDIDEFIEENRDDCEEDLCEIAFRMAVQGGYKDYVSAHTDDVELNDEGGSSSYLDDAPDEEMEQILLSAGAYRSWEDYDGCSIAIETLEWTLLSFDEAFQDAVYQRFLKVSGLSEEDIAAYLRNNGEDEPDVDDGPSLEWACEVLQIHLTDGKVCMNYYDYGDEAGDLMDFAEELGWDFDFEGDDWKLETNGVYFISDYTKQQFTDD